MPELQRQWVSSALRSIDSGYAERRFSFCTSDYSCHKLTNPR